jgi:hypothetical protein
MANFNKLVLRGQIKGRGTGTQSGSSQGLGLTALEGERGKTPSS